MPSLSVNHSMPDGTVPVIFEAAAAITALVLLGQVMELRARSERVGPSYAARPRPKTARIIQSDGREEDIPLEQVRPGDVLRVRTRRKNPPSTAW